MKGEKLMVKKGSYGWPEKFGVIGWSGVGEHIYKSWTSPLAQDTGMKIRIANTVDSVQRFKYTKIGLFDITAAGTTETSQLLEGDRRYGYRDTGPFQIRAVWVQSKTNSGYVTRGDSAIKDINDIKPGVRVVDMRSYMASQRILEAFLVWNGHIKDVEKDVVWIPSTSLEHKAKLIANGEADVAFAIPSAPPTYEAEKNPHGLRWIETREDKDPEGAKRFRSVDSLISFGPMFNGVPSCVGKWGCVGTSLYCTREDVDADFIYHLAKWLDENWHKYNYRHSWNQYMVRDNLMAELSRTFIPCHEGLIKYLKELGLWTQAHERRQKKNVDLVTRYCKANAEAIESADEKKVFVSAKNSEWVEFWENYKKELGLPKFKMFRSLEED
ncbi:MAG: hypothetical protein C4555_00690 [Dehalococcoidia bacterium]|nr:MAG: hypothetical protein C4555_00690 [Dehalococcoidia bacterium]